MVCLVDCGRLMAAPLARPHAARRGDRRRGRRRRRGGRARRPRRRDRVRARGDCGSLPPRRRGARAVVRGALRPRAGADRQRLRARVRAASAGRSARSCSCSPTCSRRRRRSRCVDAIPMLARRHAVVVASATDPDLAAAIELASRTCAATSTAPRSPLDVLAARLARRPRLRHAGAEVVEAPPPTASRRRASGRTSGEEPGSDLSAAAPRRPRASSRRRRGRPRSRAPRRGRSPRRRDEALDEPGDHEPRRRPEHDRRRARASRCSDAAARAPAGGDDRPAEAHAGRAADDDAGELEHPVRGHERRRTRRRSRADPASPPTDAEQHAVVEEDERGADPDR